MHDVSRMSQKYGCHKSEVGFLARIEVVFKEQLFHKLSQAALTIMFFGIGRKITQALVYQLLALIEYGRNVPFVVWSVCHLL